jgi:hypothetical protein
MENDFTEMGRVETLETGLTGIKIGPDGNIWYTNRINNTLMSVQPGDPVNTTAIDQQIKVGIAPNPTDGLISLNIAGIKDVTNLTAVVKNSTGKSIVQWNNVLNGQQLNMTDLPNGVYFLTLQGSSFSNTQKLIISH